MVDQEELSMNPQRDMNKVQDRLRKCLRRTVLKKKHRVIVMKHRARKEKRRKRRRKGWNILIDIF